MKYNHFEGAVYVHGDGFGNEHYFSDSGNVTLKGYKLEIAFQTNFSAGRGIASSKTIDLENVYSLDAALVMVQV